MMDYPTELRRIISKHLQFVGALAWLISIAAIPYGLINARLLSEIIAAAMNGEVDRVLKLSAIEICFVVLYKLILSCLALYKSLKDMKATQRCKMILYNHVLTSPLDLLFSSTTGGMLENLTDDFETVTSAQRSLYPKFFTAFLTVVIYSVFIGTQSLIIVFALLLLSLLQIIPPIVIRKYMQVNYERNREVEAKITDFTVAGYEGMATIKLFSLNNWYLDKLKDIHTEAQYAGRKAELTGSAQSSMNSLVSNLLQYGMYIVIGVAVFVSLATIEVGIQAIALAGGLFGAVKSVFDCIPKFSLVKKSEEKLSKWFSNHDAMTDRVKKSDYALTLDNISYQYDANVVFNNLSLKIKNDELVLLKGKNGTGKTTLLRIITGLLPQQEGAISFNSADDVDSSVFWGDILFYMPQEDAAFDLSAAELCEMLKVKPSISDFEEWGLSKTIIESSKISDLSGGERKKVYLAIVFASNPKLLILDEPSNSLDIAAKETLCNKLLQRSSGTLVVSHDECLDVLTPNIYRLEEGEIRIERHD